jgi:hypothetical protein
VEITHHCHPLHKRTGSFLFPPGDSSLSSYSRTRRDPSSPPVNSAATAALPSAGRPARPPEMPEMSRPPPPPPLNSGRRVGLPRPPPLTLDALDGNGAAVAKDEEQNGAHGVV